MSLDNNIRLHVHHAVAPYIYGTTADGQELCAEIVTEAYLPDIEHLREGDTIMLIGTEHIPDSSPARMRAHRLIIEPDYLVDISTLTACFSESLHN